MPWMFDGQPTDDERAQLADAIVEMPLKARLLDQYAGVVARARQLGVGADLADTMEAKIGEAWSALKRLSNLATMYARKFAEENPGTEGARRIENALASVALNGYASQVPAFDYIAVAAIVGTMVAVGFGVITGGLGFVAIVAAASLALANHLPQLTALIHEATSSGTNADGTVSPSITDVAKQGMNTIAIVATLAALSFGAYLFTRRPRRARA